MKTEVTKEQIQAFFGGRDPQEHIIKIEGNYNEDKIHVIYRNEEGKLKIDHNPFYPFVWCKLSACVGLYGGNREELKRQMSAYGIRCKGLRVEDTDGRIPERMKDGYRYMFYAAYPMSYTKFLEFFERGGRPVYNKKDQGIQEYIAISNIEQYMIATGKRLFKGYSDYDELTRLTWDLETEGLDPNECAISQIGIRTNKGFQKIITIEGEGDVKRVNEIKAIDEFFMTIKELDPDVITGHNTENFDWNFIDVRLQLAGSSLKDFTQDIFHNIGIYKRKKQAVLKLGGEMEYYYPTVFWGRNVTDSLHAVRRAQALDSAMKRADLKYAAAYGKIKKPNRVYIKGKLIDETWLDTNKVYAFNDENGHWFKTNLETFQKKTDDGQMRYTFNGYDNELIDNTNGEKFEFVTGRYIAERYLMDDLWEGDKVEHRYNTTNFLISKLLPMSYEKTATTGTAALWKVILMAWSYENGLALPEFTPSKKFTGGLSRLLVVGYTDRVVKLDYNSLYPSVLLTYGINTDIDITGAMSAMLEYVLTTREEHKGLKAKYGKEAKALRKRLEEEMTDDEKLKIQAAMEEALRLNSGYDKSQSQMKVLGNSFFGSYGSGSGSGFNWSDIRCAEETTCCGRQALRLMISHFTNLGYTPLVGDSFTSDTPLFIKYDDGFIDIKTVGELINEDAIHIDGLNREYDYSEKDYKVLCRSGWVTPEYIYRHKTKKKIYSIEEGDVRIDVTEDHSLYNSNREKISPKEISGDTQFEYYTDSDIYTGFNTLNPKDEIFSQVQKKYGRLTCILNMDISNKIVGLKLLGENRYKDKKMCAICQYLKECIKRG